MASQQEDSAMLQRKAELDHREAELAKKEEYLQEILRALQAAEQQQQQQQPHADPVLATKPCAPRVLRAHPECVLNLEHTSAKHQAMSLAFHPDGMRLFSGASDGTIKIWDLRTGACTATLPAHKFDVDALAISPDGKTVASGSFEKFASAWDIETLQCKAAFEHSFTVAAVGFVQGRGDTLLVSGGYDGCFRFWDLKSSTLRKELWGGGGWIRSLAVSSDGGALLAGLSDGTTRLWRLETGREEWLQWLRWRVSEVSQWLRKGDGQGSEEKCLRGHKEAVWAVAFTPCGTKCVSGSEDLSIRVWDLASGSCALTLLEAHTRYVRTLAISPDGAFLVSGAPDGKAKVWELAEGTCKAEVATPSGWVNAVAIHPDGTHFATAENNGCVRVWKFAD